MLVPRSTGPWFVPLAAQKLSWRAVLPGAFSFDQAAHTFRVARGAGVALPDLLPAALSASWLVNARATSRTFQKWLRPPLRAHWDALLPTLEGGPDAWLAHDPSVRGAVERSVRALCVDEQGVAAVSKVLAVLVPETVPLMDDAALWFAGAWVPQPTTADAPHSGAEHFVPMLDWFSRAVLDLEPALIDVARVHSEAVLDAAQVLDRLIWFESWGYRLSHAVPAPGARYWWVSEGGREGVIPVEGAHPTRGAAERVDLNGDDSPWARGASATLREVSARS